MKDFQFPSVIQQLGLFKKKLLESDAAVKQKKQKTKKKPVKPDRNLFSKRMKRESFMLVWSSCDSELIANG